MAVFKEWMCLKNFVPVSSGERHENFLECDKK